MNPERKSDYESRVPKFQFSSDLSEQVRQLAGNPLLERFRKSRSALSSDQYRPAYHFVSPEATMNDPNGLCFWQGRWHLFYQGYPPEDPRQHWGHAVSEDLVRWRDLPYAIYPDPEECCYSGSTLVEEDRVIAIYHGTKAGTMVAVSSDPLLLNWEKVTGGPVIPFPRDQSTKLPYNIFDPCIWKQDGFYYALTAGTLPNGPAGKMLRANFLHRSRDLASWEYLHPFVDDDRYSFVGDDGACPYFWPIGDHHMLLHFSHMSGGRFLLGDYDTGRQKFVVSDGGRFNFGPVEPAGVHAPSATPDSDGSIVAIFNTNPGLVDAERTWDQLMTLPRRLRFEGASAAKDEFQRSVAHRDDLRIEPAGELESVRGRHVAVPAVVLPANREVVLKGVRGNALEIQADVDPAEASSIELDVLKSEDGAERTRIIFLKHRGYRNHDYKRGGRKAPRSAVCLDTTQSSQHPGAACRVPETADLVIDDGDPVRLRVFVDRSIVEVFVNDRQCVAARVYPARPDSIGVSMMARGSDARLLRLESWEMTSIYGEPADGPGLP